MDLRGLQDRAPTCPRCGYDQRGVVALWADACPLDGTCSECGLAFSWAELFMPEKFEPRWCVEFIRDASRFISASVQTLARSFRPWRFWSALRMSYPVRRHRLFAYVVFITLPLLLGHIVHQSALTWRVHWMFMQQMALTAAAPPFALRDELAQLQLQVDMHQRVPYQPGSRMTEDQWRDWNEATIESMKRDIAAIQAKIQQATAVAAAAPLPRVPIAPEWLKAITSPWSRNPGPFVTFPNGAWTYPSPAELHEYIGGGWASALPFAGFLQTPWSGVALSPLLLVPVCFVLLPFSRKRANVRWVHIGRVLAYSAFIPVSLCFAAMLLSTAGVFLPVIDGGLRIVAELAPVGVLIWMLLWWSAAIRQYLKIPHAWTVSFMLCLLSLVLVIAVSAFVQDPMSPAELWYYFKIIFE